MFAKLLKYEWKSCAGLLGVLSAAALGVGVLGAVILRIMGLAERKAAGGEEGLFMVEMMLAAVMGFLVLALVAYVFAVEILLLTRFYKHKFTDQGYLTFTLPVNTHQIFLSSLVNFVLWTVIAGCVVAVAGLTAALVGTGRDTLINTDIVRNIMEAVQNVLEFYQYDGAMIAAAIVQGIVGVIYTPVVIMSCITMGATLAKRHKILTAFGIYYGVNMGIGVVTSAVTVAVEVARYAQNSYDGSGYVMSSLASGLIQMAVQLAVLVGGYFLSTHLMRKNLNLP